MTPLENPLIPELSVVDFRRSLSFYVEILNFSVAYTREEEGFAFLTLGNAQLMIDQIDRGRTWATGPLNYPLGRGVNFSIQVDRLEPLLEQLRDHGIELFMEPEEKWYRVGNHQKGNMQFIVQDPDGYLLRFVQQKGTRPYPD
jgi:catechol 2,3-dioxygenase-like lactoylglutathione lyase family enzyme